jgi:cell division protein FtsZ
MLAESTLPTARYDTPAPRPAEVPIVPRYDAARRTPMESAAEVPVAQAAPEPETEPVAQVQPIAAETVAEERSAPPAIEVQPQVAEPVAEVVSQIPPVAPPPVPPFGEQPSPYARRSEDWQLTPPPSEQAPELVPVPRSVFDDDFFRTGRVPAAQTSAADTRMPSARGFDSPDPVRPVRIAPEPETHQSFPTVPEPAVRVPSFSGYAPEAKEADELDIPAFLRRGH